MSNEKTISLQPLKFEEAISDLLKVKPPKKKPHPMREGGAGKREEPSRNRVRKAKRS